jgi:hypothetical protein
MERREAQNALDGRNCQDQTGAGCDKGEHEAEGYMCRSSAWLSWALNERLAKISARMAASNAKKDSARARSGASP